MQSQNLQRIFQNILSIVQRDLNNRGIKHILPENNLQNFIDCIQNLIKSQQCLIFTGFQCNVDYDFKAENDGIAGALIIARQLSRLGKSSRIIIDKAYESEFRKVSQYYIKNDQNITISSYQQLTQQDIEELNKLKEQYDTFFSIERPSYTKTNQYYTMGAKDITNITSPIDQIFFNSTQIGNIKDGKTRICIGDGGNEIGMGNVYEQVIQNVKNGHIIAANSVCDNLLVCDVSNWGTYAVTEGICIQQFQNQNEFTDYGQYSEKYGINIKEELEFYKYIGEVGFRDGIVKKLDGTLDGQPLSKTEEILIEIKNQFQSSL